MAFELEFFKEHKAKWTKKYRETLYWEYLWETLASSFEWNGLPDSLPAEWIEGILRTNGIVGIGEIEGTLYAAPGGYYGNVNGYIPTKFKGAVVGIGTLDGPAVSPGIYDLDNIGDKPIVVAWNNALMSPDIDIYDVAHTLAENRTSEDINLIFSRLLRIPIARNSKEKAIIDSAIKAIIDGKIEAVASDIKDLQTAVNGVPDRQFLDLIDVKEVDKLQYLNQYHDNILKRFMQRHGHAMQITSKLAQQTNAEMHGADDISMIVPLQELKYRKKLADMLNKYYDLNVSVEFGELLKNNYDRIVNYVPDELNEKNVVSDDVDTVESEVENNEKADGDNSGDTDDSGSDD